MISNKSFSLTIIVLFLFPFILYSQISWDYTKVLTTPARPYIDIAFGNNTFVALDRDGGIITSEDGLNWVIHDQGFSDTLNAITFLNGKFYLLGGSGLVLESIDGILWVQQEFISQSDKSKANVKDIVYGNSRYVLLTRHEFNDDVSMIYTKTDTTDWLLLDDEYELKFIDMEFADSTFVAVGINGYALRSKTGTYWEVETITGDVDTMHAITYGGEHFVTASHNKSYRSVDGITWTADSIECDFLTVKDIIYLDTMFVMVGYFHEYLREPRILTSQDGLSWTLQDTAIPARYLQAVEYGNGKYVSVGLDSLISISEDAIDWTTEEPSRRLDKVSSTFINDVIHGDSGFIAVGDNGFVIYSDNGKTWKVVHSKTDHKLREAIFANGKYLAIGDSGTIIISENGRNWSEQLICDSATLTGIIHNGDAFFVCGNMPKSSTMSWIWKSEDNGSTWNSACTETRARLLDIAYGNNLFIGVGKSWAEPMGETIISSNGFDEWSITELPTGYGIFSKIIFDGSKFIRLNYTNNSKFRMHTSEFGNTWSKVEMDTSIRILDMLIKDNRYVAITEKDTVITSVDLINWDAYSISEDLLCLKSITYGNGLYVTAGRVGEFTPEYSPDTNIIAYSNDINLVPNQSVHNDNKQIMDISFSNNKLIVPALQMYDVKDAELSIYSMDGKLMKLTKLNNLNKEIIINLEFLSPGCYVYNLNLGIRKNIYNTFTQMY